MKTITLLLCALCINAALFAQTLGLRSSRTFGSSTSEKGQAVKSTSDGGYIAVGQSSGNGGDVSGHHGMEDIWVIKTHATGAIEWQKNLGGDSSDLYRSILQNNDGSFTIFGLTYSRNGDVTGYHGNGDIWVVNVSSSGNIVWTKALGGAQLDDIRYVDKTPDNGYILAGYTSSNDGDDDFWVVN
jgi:hypothetical protein